MKPLALALAVAVLGSGCIVVDDGGPTTCGGSNLTLEWDFRLSTGTVTGCATAGVQWVDVWVGSDLADSFWCSDGGGTVWAPAGSVVTVEGVDAAGRIAYRDWVTAPSGCGTHYAPVRPAEGTANLYYGVDQSGCTSSPCYLWFSIYDESAGTWAAVIDPNSPTSVKTTFPYPGDVVVRLAVGSYTLDWMELVSSGFLGEQMTCAAAPFDVAAATETVVSPALTAACVPLP